MAIEIIYDDGNESNKSCTHDKEYEFQHASAQLSRSKYEELVGLGDSDGLYIINGVHYVMGERAMRMGSVRHEGSNRYNPNYYKRFLATSLYHLLDKNSRNVFVYASLPPKDNAYKDTIKDIALGDIEISHVDKITNKEITRRFTVTGCNTWYEPVGGTCNRLMSPQGYKIENIGLHIGETLVIDIGGLTTDYIILSDGIPDFASARSWTERNIIDTLEEFKIAIIKRYGKELQTSRDLPMNNVRSALKTSYYKAGAHGLLDCTYEADEACNAIVSAVEARYQLYGGATLDNVLLTGGGSGLLESRIKEVMKIDSKWRAGVYMADTENIQRANMRGAKNLLQFYKNQGVKIG